MIIRIENFNNFSWFFKRILIVIAHFWYFQKFILNFIVRKYQNKPPEELKRLIFFYLFHGFL